MWEKIKENKVVSILVAGTAIALTVAAVKAFGGELSEELQEVVEEVTESNN